MIATIKDVLDSASFITSPTILVVVCLSGVTVVVLFTQLARRPRHAARRAGRHRRVATRRLLPGDTQVIAVANDRASSGVVEPRTGTDRRSGVFPARFPFGVRLMCTDDVTVVTDSSLVGSR